MSAEQSPAASPAYPIQYRFEFPDGKTVLFKMQVNPQTLQLLIPARESFPDWTRLEHCKCPNCPLSEKDSPQCPAANALVDVVEAFHNVVSYDEVAISIETEERNYTKQTTVQTGLSSLVGLSMVTSGCPILAKFKPMVRHHLPFANLAETVYRALSMYLLAQYLRSRRGQQPDWKLEHLKTLYEEIHLVNKSFSQRLLHIVKEDANLNALSILDIFGQTVAFTIDERMLDSLEEIFQPYFD
jgi:hypothetical protein